MGPREHGTTNLNLGQMHKYSVSAWQHAGRAACEHAGNMDGTTGPRDHETTKSGTGARILGVGMAACGHCGMRA